MENTKQITNQDLFKSTVNMAASISQMRDSINTLKQILKEKREFNEDEYASFVDLFTIEGSDTLTQEEFNAFVRSDFNKINNTIVLADKEIKQETKRYIELVKDIQKNYPDVYSALQEYTTQVLSSTTA